MVTLRQAEAMVGIPYVDGQADCMHLAVRAASQLFGRVVPWPHQAHPLGGARQTALMRRHASELARALGDAELPVAGDVALFTRGVAGSAERHWHVGTVLLHQHRVWLLHTSQALGCSVLQPLDGLPAQGLRFEGFYRWL